jgi:outer membrane protein TolC
MRSKILALVILLFCQYSTYADSTFVFSLKEFVGVVVKFHPVAKQAEILKQQAKANLLSARGQFDPTIRGSFDQKTFDNKNYWQQLLTEVSIPTWYGLQPKIGFEFNEGLRESDNSFKYIGSDRVNLPNGLLYTGVKASIGSGLLIDERRTFLKQAKSMLEQSEFDRQNSVNDLLFYAHDVYNEWSLSFTKVTLLKEAVNIGRERIAGLKKSVEYGDLAGIDTVEALSQLQSFEMLLAEEIIQLNSIKFQLNTFLWNENNQPIFLEQNIVPVVVDELEIFLNDTLLKNEATLLAQNHPKVKSIEQKIEQLELEEKLKLNKLLPKIDVNYNVLLNDATRNPSIANNNYTQNYKWGVDVQFPIFIRAERGQLQSIKLKISDNNYTFEQVKNSIVNKILDYKVQTNLYQSQVNLASTMVENFNRVLNAEKSRFELGESSIFLINSREQKLYESRLKRLEAFYKFNKSNYSLNWSAGLFAN